mmetsp:Transcript_18553/g.38948  ORF Transcript_18553/g.38948 Transcript_18553/m.38948 type:complete len:149 (+) Transcript_18553:122-568(+)
MRHGARWAKLGRDTAHRVAMLRNMVTSLIEHESIETTIARAKALRRVADRMITFAKDATPHARTRLFAFIRTRDALEKIQSDLANRFRDRQGGYTRVLRTRRRRGDNAQMAVIEWTETDKTILTQIQLAARKKETSRDREEKDRLQEH